MAAGAFDYNFDTSTRDVGLVCVVVEHADADPVPVPVSSLIPAERLKNELLRVIHAYILPRQKKWAGEYRQREDALSEDERKLIAEIEESRLEWINFVWSETVQDVFEDGFGAGADLQAANTIREFSVVPGIDVVTESPATAQALVDITRISTEKLQYVGNAYHDQVASIIYNGFVDGTSTKDIAKLLQGRSHVLDYRSEFIARNEMGTLYSEMTRIRQTDNGVVSYIWRTAEDERVRPSHAEKNGRVFQWDDPPPDTGAPGDDWNCRCYAEPILSSIDPEITGQVGSPGRPAIGVEEFEVD